MSGFNMEIHEWMLNYTRQTEWIDRRGLILWIAFYTGGLGGGLYLVSVFFNSIWGMFISWLIIAVLKGGAHLLSRRSECSLRSQIRSYSGCRDSG